MTNKIRILLIDSQSLFRQGLRALMLGSDFEIVAEAADDRAAIQAADAIEYELTILDVSLPGSSGMALLRELCRRRNRGPVLVLSTHDESDVVLDALAAGASGYALKNQSYEELADAIRSVVAGQRYLPPSMSSDRLADAQRQRHHPDGATLGQLSAREREVFDLIVQGDSNASAAKKLFISVKTVETHRTRIMRKLEVHSVAEIVRFAARHGLLAPPVDRVVSTELRSRDERASESIGETRLLRVEKDFATGS